MMLEWLNDPVFQIREEAVSILVQLKEGMFDVNWLEGVLKDRIEEFHISDKFNQRMNALMIITKSQDEVRERFLNETIFPALIVMAGDPVPNVRFNVAKTLPKLKDRLSNSNKLKASELLEKMEGDEDNDVKYYSNIGKKTFQ